MVKNSKLKTINLEPITIPIVLYIAKKGKTTEISRWFLVGAQVQLLVIERFQSVHSRLRLKIFLELRGDVDKGFFNQRKRLSYLFQRRTIITLG